MLEKFSLAGKTALVTGCSRGIGKDIAVALAQAGADIVGVSASLDAQGSDVGNAVEAAGKKFNAYQCDFSDRASVFAFANSVIEDNAAIDILVNNAGTIARAPAAEHSDEFWDTVLSVNLSSQFVLSREIGKTMIERGRGKIIFTSSLLAFQGGITVPGYAASKGGVGQLVMALSNEWASKGVNVNAIAPGYIATDNTAALRADEARSSAILERIPQARWGTPEDIAWPVVFLASAASDYMNGSTVTVDGGWMGR